MLRAAFKIIGGFILEYWKPICIAIIIALIWFNGYATGKNGEREACLDDKRQFAERSQKIKDELQKRADTEAANYIKWKGKYYELLNKADTRLNAEITSSPVLRDCVASAGFLRIYDEVSPGADIPADPR